jgi:hypothetical protein
MTNNEPPTVTDAYFGITSRAKRGTHRATATEAMRDGDASDYGVMRALTTQRIAGITPPAQRERHNNPCAR